MDTVGVDLAMAARWLASQEAARHPQYHVSLDCASPSSQLPSAFLRTVMLLDGSEQHEFAFPPRPWLPELRKGFVMKDIPTFVGLILVFNPQIHFLVSVFFFHTMQIQIKVDAWNHITIFSVRQSRINFHHFHSIFLVIKNLEGIATQQQVIGGGTFRGEIGKHGQTTDRAQSKVGIEGEPKKEQQHAGSVFGFGQMHGLCGFILGTENGSPHESKGHENHRDFGRGKGGIVHIFSLVPHQHAGGFKEAKHQSHISEKVSGQTTLLDGMRMNKQPQEGLGNGTKISKSKGQQDGMQRYQDKETWSLKSSKAQKNGWYHFHK
mmetsp:Transcript_33256/g.69276  ORF Transcript_33256/g.69276 Transcript_33256/m.69276 type:complete len:321 (-) Transcript_33256:731-1693(-)